MLLLLRTPVQSLSLQLFYSGCVLLLAAAAGCGKPCPDGFVERDTQCIRAAAEAEIDASTQENSVEGTDAGAHKPDAGPGKPGANSGSGRLTGGRDAGDKTDNAGDKTDKAGTGGSVAGSGGSSGAAGQPVPMEPEPASARKCLVGESRCSDKQAAVEVCTVDDNWMQKESCPARCKDGACAGDCKPGARHCGANQSIETCSAMAVCCIALRPCCCTSCRMRPSGW